MNKYDFIIIGSGFGGSITACRLSQAGFKVLLLERGKKWKASEYPRKLTDEWIFSSKNPEKKHGWFEFRSFGKMSVIQAAGVGGGSLAYANVSVEAKPNIFNKGWPTEITYNELKPFYEMVGDMLSLEELPDNQLTKRFKLVKEGAISIGMGSCFEKLPLAIAFNKEWSYDLPEPFNESHSLKFINKHGIEQGTCIHCGNCDIGCKVNARNTLENNYLALAEKFGAEVRPLHIATSIHKTNDGYSVHFDKISGEQKTSSFELSKCVVVSAGSINSTELLLRCRDQYNSLPLLSKFLGKNWSSNGDFLTPSFYKRRTISPSHGPTITCAINFLDTNDNDQKFFIEDGGIPRVLETLLKKFSLESMINEDIEEKLGSEVIKSLNRYYIDTNSFDDFHDNPCKSMMPWFSQGIDAGDGCIFLDNNKLKMDWKVNTNKAVINSIISTHKKLALATGGVARIPLTWRKFKMLITPHPLGGCNMGSNPNNGVVNHKGEVFNYPGLYIADGSIIPVPVGLNPSRTISALAERIATHIIADMNR